MAKPGKSSFPDVVIPPAPPRNDVIVQSHDDAKTRLRDEDVPEATIEEVFSPKADRTKKASTSSSKRAGRDGDIHRSLYAKPETIKLIRQIAVNEDTTSQALFREGLLLMLQKRGMAEGKTRDDM